MFREGWYRSNCRTQIADQQSGKGKRRNSRGSRWFFSATGRQPVQKRETFELLTRIGFAARGLLYLIIAWLVISAGRAADLTGAIEYLANDRTRVLLIAMLAGFVAYGVWRLADAALDTEGHGDDGKGKVKRAGAAVSGIVYLFLAYQAYQLLDGSKAGSGNGTQEQARTVLDLPGGPLLLGLGAAILFGVGVWQLVKAAKASFLEHLDPSARSADWVRWFGRFGYGARGVIFMVTAFFLARAALKDRASEAGGMEQALAWLSHPVNLIVATGLALFGIFSLVEARHRIIHAPDPGELPRPHLTR
jgi:hypothetical protein